LSLIFKLKAHPNSLGYFGYWLIYVMSRPICVCVCPSIFVCESKLAECWHI